MLKQDSLEIRELELVNLPNNNNDEIKHVPTISHVGVLVHHQTVSDDLQKGLDCKNNEEGILNCFLEMHKKKKRENKQIY